MVFKKFVQIGRVARVNFGKDEGKLCVIVNVLDLGKVLVEGPVEVTGVIRQKMSVRRLDLTDYVVKVPVHARASTVKKALEKDDIINKFNSSPEGKTIAIKKARAEMTDFDRFKLMVAKKTRSRAVRAKLAELRSKA